MFSESGDLQHIRRTKHKDYPSEATVAKLKETKVWKMENEFYQFAHSHFTMLKEELSEIARFRAKFGTERLYHYEKIRRLKPL